MLNSHLMAAVMSCAHLSRSTIGWQQWTATIHADALSMALHWITARSGKRYAAAIFSAQHMLGLSAASAAQICGHNVQGQRCGRGGSASGAGGEAAAALGERIQAALEQWAASWRHLQLPSLLKASFRCRQATSPPAHLPCSPPSPPPCMYHRVVTVVALGTVWKLQQSQQYS